MKGICVTALDPITEKGQQQIDAAIERLSKRFHRRLAQPAFPVPPLLNLMAFRMSRTSMKLMLNNSYRDYTYFTEKGLVESAHPAWPTSLI